jgi:spore coat polysaccharide biosynthesis protein SpsF (cytidylyltransferase family)
MKIERVKHKQFEPITITLETHDEYRLFRNIVNRLGYGPVDLTIKDLFDYVDRKFAQQLEDEIKTMFPYEKL